MNVLIELLAKATLVLLAAVALSWALRRAPAAARHGVWAAALAALALLPIGLSLPPLWTVALPAPPPEPALAAAPHAATFPAAAVALEPAAVETPPAVSWPAALLGIYLLGAAAALARLALDHRALGRLIRSCQPIVEGRPSALAAEAARTMGLAGSPSVRLGADVPVPLVAGWRRPVLLLPATAALWDDDRLRVVLLHEAAHLSRRDWPILLAADWVTALWWFHPLVWLAAARLRAEAETACDEAVLSAGVAPVDYAAHLLEVLKMLKSRLPFSAPAAGRSSRIDGRVRAILAFVPSRSLRRAALPLALAGLSLVSVLSARPIARAALQTANQEAADAQRRAAEAARRQADLAIKKAGLRVREERKIERDRQLSAEKRARDAEQRARKDARRQQEILIAQKRRLADQEKEVLMMADKKAAERDRQAQIRARQAEWRVLADQPRRRDVERLDDELSDLTAQIQDLQKRIIDKRVERAGLEPQVAAGTATVGPIDLQLKELEKLLAEAKDRREQMRDRRAALLR